jgi:hypothetical protein
MLSVDDWVKLWHYVNDWYLFLESGVYQAPYRLSMRTTQARRFGPCALHHLYIIPSERKMETLRESHKINDFHYEPMDMG